MWKSNRCNDEMLFTTNTHNYVSRVKKFLWDIEKENDINDDNKEHDGLNDTKPLKYLS